MVIPTKQPGQEIQNIWGEGHDQTTKTDKGPRIW